MNVDSIQAAIFHLKSTKIGERKKGAESILELIRDNDGVCRALDYNSMHQGKDKDKFTWTTLFNEVRDYFAKETEKINTSHGGNVQKTFYLNVVDRVLQKGTSQRPWIECNRILDFITMYLSQEVYAIVYGTSLLSMLQNFLSIELYVSIIEANSWTELIKLLLKVYGKYDIPTLTVLRCLNISIQEGSNHPPVIGTLRSDVVRFYETAFSSDRSKNRSHIVFFLRGVTALCRRNAVEFRGILCKLGEGIIPSVLYSNSYVAEEEGAIVEFLLVQLQLHAPCDVHIKSSAFYADDHKKWLEISKSIYSFCLDTIEDIATKKSSPFHKELEVNIKLILLAAKCTKQIFDSQVEEHSSSGDEDEPNPIKKTMRYRSFSNVLSEVCSRNSPSESQIVWMNYLTAVLIEFPGLVGSRMNYSCLFNMGLSFMNSSFVTRREIYLFFLCLLRTEKFLIDTDVLKNRSKSWENVWDITLRSLSINGSISEALELLRNLLIEVQPSNVNGLLILYVQGSMPITAPSLHLLAEYLSRCSLPLYMGSSSTGESVGSNVVHIGVEIASTTCPRLSLIRWLVHSEEEPELGHEPLISAILCSLLVRQTHNLIYAEKFCDRPNGIRIPSELNQFEIVYDDFEKVILSCCFVHVPGKHCGGKEEINAQESLLLSLMPTAPGRMVEALVDDFDKLPVFDHSSYEFTKKFTQLNYRVALYLSILNVLEKHSIGNEDSLGFRTNLEKLFDKALTKCMETAIDFITKGKDKSAIQVQEVISIMRNLLRSGHLCDKIKLVLSQRFPQQMQELLKKIYRSNLTRYIERAANNPGDTVMFGGQDLLARLYFSSTGESSGVSEGRQIELAALEGLNALLDYGIMCDHRTDLFTDILKDCMAEPYHSGLPFVFEFGSELASRMTPVLNRGNCSELLTVVTNLLQKMCRGYFQNTQCSVRLWELFADITEITGSDIDVNKKNLMVLVGTLSGFMKTGTAYGSSISVCQAAFRSLSEVAKSDQQLSWSIFSPKTATPVWVLHEVYEFLNNASHQVRLFAADTLCVMYKHAAPPTPTPTNSQESGSRTAPLSNKRADYYEKIFQFLQKMFNVATNLTADEIAQEAANITSVTVLCLSKLIFAYPFIQQKSLFSLLKLVKSKQIEVALVNRALNYSSSTAAKTMCCHVSYLLQQWMQLNYPIEEFPYTFFGCDTMGTFYARYRKEISVEFFQKNDTDGLSKFAKFFNLETVALIKECYGMMMARIVPGLSVYTTKHVSFIVPPRDNEFITQLLETQKRLTLALGGKSNTESLMMTSLGDVILQLVSLVFDPLIPSAWGCPDIRLPEPAPPFHDETWIDTSVNFLKEASSRKDISIIAFLATYSAKSIYDTLLTLITRVHNAHDALQKFWRLHQFAYFVKQLLQEPQLVFNQMKEYVCQFVVYAYLRLLSSETGEDTYSKYLRHALIYLISKLVLILALSYKEEMKQYYYAIVNGLVSSAIKYPDLIEPAKKPLDLLLKNYVDDYAECVVSLDPFPSHIEEFAEYREIYLQMKYGQRRADWPLQKELRSCLSEIQSSHGSCTKERLEFLRELLSTKKKDLERLVRNLEGKQFSDDCTSDMLHNLIQMLVGVIKSGEDEEAAWEACRCLGEIGPVDLSVLVLPVCPSTKELKKMVSSITTVVEIAAEYLKSDEIRVVSITGEVLRSMCSMEECAELLSKEMAKTRLDAILKPFKTAGKTIKSLDKVSVNELESKLGLNEMNEFIDYPTWITQLTCGLIGCLKTGESLTYRLLPLCELKVDFCQQVLPFVVYGILFTGRNNPLVRKTLSGYFRNFFSKFVHNQSSLSECSRSFTPIMGAHQVSIYLNKLALRSLLGVVQFLRNHQAPQEFKGSLRLTPWDNNLWLEINYLELAKAAQHCGAFLTSILCTEIAATDLEMGGSGHIEDLGDEDLIESFYSQGTTLFPRNRGESFEKLLLKAYTSVGEPDAVYGCGSARFSDCKMNIRHLQQRMQWNRVLSACDGNAVDSDSVIESGVGSSMKEMGLYNTLWTYLQGIETREKVLDQELAEIQYECGWRLSKWNLHCDKATYVKDGSLSQSGKGHGMLQRYIYESVQTGIASDVVNHIENIRRGYTSVAKDLRHASIESSENLYGFLSQLQMLRVVEDFFHMETSDNGNVDDFLSKWKLQDRINTGDFKFQEPILYLRNILLRSYEQRHPRPDLENAYDDCMLELLSKARDSGRLGFAENCTACISATSDRIIKKDLEVAKNHWARGDQDIARHILGRLLKKSSPEGCELYPVMLLLYGEWLSISMSERPSVILDKYLHRSCQIYEKRSGASQADTAKAHFVLAKYADAQYQNVSKYVKSDFFTEKIAHYEKAKTDVAAISNAQDNDTRRTALVLRKQSNIDEEEIKVTIDQRHKFLILALRHYLRGLKDSNDQDLLIFRAVALWLENGDTGEIESDRIVNAIFKQETMPSYKYIVVLHQLSARMNGNSKGMADILISILVKCAQQHPYHSLPVLLTQALLHKDQEMVRNSSCKKQLEDRVKAASKLVESIKKDRKLGQLAQKMDKLWVALISLANFHESKSASGTVNMPSNAQLRTLKSLEIVAVPTTAVPVSIAAEYNDNIIGIVSFDYAYNLVGGINSPKRISCTGTNGVKFNMLLKGQDDLRQDAVMQQVFGVMNKLLLAETRSKVRRLHVRTYKVVPLSQRSGILEWCENTQTFGDYLVNNETGAHQKYRPNDYLPHECRRKMLDVKDCGDNDKKYGNFMTIMEHFKPVFRHFFFEKFKEAGTFFERRLAYTRSVATNSMVGYVLGLGDRHVLNILLDNTTAEFIHIDLGVAFEQGRILPTPETIPFRLTRDVVDGMGVSGVEGVFRKSCEMTLEVLRNNSEIILTILEVLLYDPLYMWTLTPDRMKKVQPMENSRGPLSKRANGNTSADPIDDAPKERNSSAARVLLRLRQKLAGIEEGGSSGSILSVPGHVSLLIQRALDPEKLSRLFPGWQPYL